MPPPAAVADNTDQRRTEMGKIVISENVSLDGVVEDPTGEEGFRHGGWFSQFGDKDREAWAKVEFDEALDADAMLLGRRSYEYFAVRWQPRSGGGGGGGEKPPQEGGASPPQNTPWEKTTGVAGGGGGGGSERQEGGKEGGVALAPP